MKNRQKQSPIYHHPLMENNITRDDLNTLIEYLSSEDPKLTQGAKVLEFEAKWSEWLGVKHSVYVNSGSSANLITMAVVRELYGSGEIIVPPLTWVSDIAACLQNGFRPIFADIDPRTLALNVETVIEKISHKTKAVFLTHVQGFNGLTNRMLAELEKRDIPLIEDVCESHGAVFRQKKLGTFGIMSNFSFYYAHHMSTIEGGMVCTDNEEIYQLLRMFRSHGMVRESSSDAIQKKYARETNALNPDFIFAFPAYNVRGTELGAVIGLNQLKRLDKNNRKRVQNNKLFLNALDSQRFRTDFDLQGSCNYAFNVILNEPNIRLRDDVELALNQNGIEHRRGSSGGGNQIRQPYLREYVDYGLWESFPEVEHIHHFGWYIGNFPSLEQKTILNIADVLNNA